MKIAIWTKSVECCDGFRCGRDGFALWRCGFCCITAGTHPPPSLRFRCIWVKHLLQAALPCILERFICYAEGSAYGTQRERRALIAEYAKIALTDDELTQMTSYMNDAVQMLEPVLQYDLPDVEPTFHPIGSLSNVMGDDLREPERDLPLDIALENAGSARDRYFRVPSILGEGESE